MENDIKSLLLIGSEININDKFNLKFPTLENIINVGYAKIMSTVNIVYDINFALFNNKEINRIIEENNWCSFDTFNFIIALELNSKEKVITNYLVDFIKFHTINTTLKIDENANIIINNSILTKEDFNKIAKVLEIAYSLEERIEDREFSSVQSRSKAIEMRVNRAKIDMIQNKDDNFIYQLISSLKIKKNNEEIQSSTIFQLIDMFKRLNKEKEYEHLMQGVYSGTVDVKKININEKHWTTKT